MFFIFDLDGTLGSWIGHFKVFESALKEVANVDFKWDNSLDGTTDRTIIEHFVGKENQDLVDKVIKKMSEDFVVGDYTLFEGVPEVLEELSKKYKVFLISGSLKAIAEKKIESFGNVFFDKFFGDNVKTRIELVKGVLKDYLDYKNEQGIMVGDTPVDVSTAKHFKFKAVAVTTGDFSREELKDADYVIDSLNELKRLKFVTE